MNNTIDPYRKKLGVNDAVCGLLEKQQNNSIEIFIKNRQEQHFKGVLIILKPYLSSIDKSLNS